MKVPALLEYHVSLRFAMWALGSGIVSKANSEQLKTSKSFRDIYEPGEVPHKYVNILYLP